MLAKQQLFKDSLSLHRKESEKILKEIYERMKFMATGNDIEKEIYSLSQLKSEFVAYNNIMLIIASYVAQKMHCYDLVKELIKECINSAYVAMWNKWVEK